MDKKCYSFTYSFLLFIQHLIHCPHVYYLPRIPLSRHQEAQVECIELDQVTAWELCCVRGAGEESLLKLGLGVGKWKEIESRANAKWCFQELSSDPQLYIHGCWPVRSGDAVICLQELPSVWSMVTHYSEQRFHVAETHSFLGFCHEMVHFIWHTILYVSLWVKHSSCLVTLALLVIKC